MLSLPEQIAPVGKTVDEQEQAQPLNRDANFVLNFRNYIQGWATAISPYPPNSCSYVRRNPELGPG